MKTERSMTELVAAIRGGDQDAFTELYEQTSQEVYRSARAVLRDEDEALDVQQDTFVYAYQHLDQLSEPEKLRPWLRTIAVNRAKSVLRKNTPVLFTELENDEGEGLPEQADLSLDASPELSLERKETAELVSEILSGLSDGQRAAVAMYYYEQMSVNEIADSLGVAPSTIKNQLSKGRKKIEEAVRTLEKKGVKLYGLSPVGFLVALMKKQAPTAQAGQTVLAKTLAKAGLAAGTKTAAAASVTAVPVTTSTFGHVLAGRIVAGVLTVALIGGGIWGGAKLLKSSNTDAPYQPTTSVTDERMAGVETPEELTETVEPETEAVVAPADATVNSVTTDTAEDLPVTEPVVTEPVVTEPAATEAVTTEPTEPARAANQCGENLTWNISKYGTLVIEGGGAMDDYDDKENRAPWYESRDKFDSVSLPEGLSSIGSYAFCDLTNLDDPDYLNGRFYWINIPNSVVSVGSHAFQNANIVNLVLPESLSSVADSALSGCTALRELWVMNPDCAFGAEQEVSPELEVCGFPDSTAERFAREKGCSFNPMTPDQDAVVEQLRAEEPGRQGTRIIWAAKCAAGYMAKVVTFEPVSVTEEELQQAKQTGSMVVDGVECAYTESRGQAEEWGYVNEDSEATEGWSGWIHKDGGNGKGVYSVLREGDHYIFYKNYPHGESDHVLRQEEPKDLAWFLMDDNTLVDFSGVRLGEFLAKDNYYARNFPGDMFYYPNLHLTEEGEIFVEVVKYGAQR